MIHPLTLIGFSMACLLGGTLHAQERKLSPPIEKAWRQVGAGFGWDVLTNGGLHYFSHSEPTKHVGLPAIEWRSREFEAIATLPPPEQPFALKIWNFEAAPLSRALNLARMKRLTALDLVGDWLTDEQIKELPSIAALRRLSVNSGRVSRAGFASIARCMNLEQLSFSNNASESIVDDKLAVEIAKLERLRHLTLRGNKLTANGIKALATLSEVRSLDLSNSSGISDDAMKHVARLTNLEHLVLHHTPITDKGLSFLAPALKLQSLYLQGTDVSGTPIKDFPTLTILALGKGASDAGLKALREIKHLTYLDISSALITHRGLAELAVHKNLESLNLSIKVDDACARELGRIKSLKWVRLSPGLTNEGIKHIAGLVNLQSLDIHAGDMTDEGLAALTGLERLEFLSLYLIKMKGDGMKHLAQFKSLTALDLRCTYLRDVDIAELVKLQRLKYLNLSERRDADVARYGLARLQNLESLDLQANEVSDDDFRELTKLKHLKKLNLIRAKTNPTALAEFRKTRPDVDIIDRYERGEY